MIGELFAREGRVPDTTRFAFKDAKVRVTATEKGAPKFEGGNVGIIGVNSKNRFWDGAAMGIQGRIWVQAVTTSSDALVKRGQA